MFALKLEPSLASKENLQKHLQSSLKGKQIKKHSESFLCVLLIKSRGPTVISYWPKNRSCVLYRSYPGRLRSFKRPAYLEVLREKLDFFLGTNLGWRSANAIIKRRDYLMNCGN